MKNMMKDESENLYKFSLIKVGLGLRIVFKICLTHIEGLCYPFLTVGWVLYSIRKDLLIAKINDKYIPI